MKRIILPLTLLASALLNVGCGNSSNAVAPTTTVKNGNIYYVRTNKGAPGTVRTVAEDGTGGKLVFENGDVLVSAPQSGKMVLITVDSVAHTRSLALADSAGTILKQLSVAGSPTLAELSPDGKKICYGFASGVSSQSSELHLINSDGTNDIKIPMSGAWESVVAFSPDSKMLVFYADDGTFPNNKLYVINSDGTNLRMLADNAAGISDGFGGLAWSPAGDKILFMRADSMKSEGYDIWSISPTKPETANLTADIDQAMLPMFSPDGKTIAFVSGAIDSTNIDIWLMNADGTNKRNLTKTPVASDAELHPRWSPDGKKLLCLSFDLSSTSNVFTGKLKLVDVATGTSSILTGTPDVAYAFWGR
ncbi:MAG: hypothetical protein ABIQ57_09495 [Candidatus Kapaibacterium sp.]